MKRKAKRGEAMAWLLAHVPHKGEACLIWPFSCNWDGYGQIGLQRGVVRKAHHVMCRLAHGKPPTRRHQASHSCGNGHAGCVNQEHLSWKTNSENQKDRRRHGTHLGAKGARTQLTAAQVAEIRSRGEAQTALAARFGVSRGCIEYWQRTTHDPFPFSTEPSAISRRQFHPQLT